MEVELTSSSFRDRVFEGCGLPGWRLRKSALLLSSTTGLAAGSLALRSQSSDVTVAGIVDFLLIRSTAKPTSNRCFGRELQTGNKKPRIDASQRVRRVQDPL